MRWLTILAIVATLTAIALAKPAKGKGKGGGGNDSPMAGGSRGKGRPPKTNKDRIRKGRKSKDVDVESNAGKKAYGQIRKGIDEIVKGGKDKSSADEEGYSLKKIFEDDDGERTTRRFGELYKGVPVFGHDVVERVVKGGKKTIKSKDGKTEKEVDVPDQTIVSGTTLTEIDTDVGEVDLDKLDTAAAVEALKKELDIQADEKVLYAECKPVIYVDAEIDDAAAMLVFHCEIGIDDAGYAALLDAESLELISFWQTAADVEHKGTGPGGDTRNGKLSHTDLAVIANGTVCNFESDNFKVIDLDGAELDKDNVAGYASKTFTCYDNPEKQINGAYSPVNDVVKHLAIVEEMYSTWYATFPLDTTAGKFPVFVNDNMAEYGGVNAYFWGYYRVISLGKGGGSYFPLVSLDVVSHEVGHGVVQYSSGLAYSNQPGGLNEAFADMAGVSARYLEWRKTKGDTITGFNWMMGDSLFTTAGNKFRCIDNPTCTNGPIDNVQNYQAGMDPHYSSGPFNKAFYLMSTKFAYKLWDAFDVFYFANKNYWNSQTTYKQAAETALRTAHELVHSPGTHVSFTYTFNIQDAIDAFTAIGLTCANNAGTATYTCT